MSVMPCCKESRTNKLCLFLRKPRVCSPLLVLSHLVSSLVLEWVMGFLPLSCYLDVFLDVTLSGKFFLEIM